MENLRKREIFCKYFHYFIEKLFFLIFVYRLKIDICSFSEYSQSVDDDDDDEEYIKINKKERQTTMK